MQTSCKTVQEVRVEPAPRGVQRAQDPGTLCSGSDHLSEPEQVISSLWTCDPTERWEAGSMLFGFPADPDICVSAYRAGGMLLCLQRKAPIHPEHLLQGRRWQEPLLRRTQVSALWLQRWSLTFLPLLKVRGLSQLWGHLTFPPN